VPSAALCIVPVRSRDREDVGYELKLTWFSGLSTHFQLKCRILAEDQMEYTTLFSPLPMAVVTPENKLDFLAIQITQP